MPQSKAVRIVLGYVLFSAFFGAYAYDLNIARYNVPPAGRAAMQWAQENTAPTARFIVLTGSPDPFSDASGEWFPVLAGRTSENTIQGREWTLAQNFMPFLNSLESLQSCLNQNPACVEGWAEARGIDFNYIYVQKPAGKDAAGPSRLLYVELKQSQDYSQVFENEGAAIFERK